eukprot:1258744-Rhodomonas_salina.2
MTYTVLGHDQMSGHDNIRHDITALRAGHDSTRIHLLPGKISSARSTADSAVIELSPSLLLA